MFPNSLAFRLIALTAAWAIVALLTTAIILTTILRQNAERSFNDLLQAHLYNLIGGVEVGNDGLISNQPSLGDPKFRQPNSGWYWMILPVSPKAGDGPKSRSLSGDTLSLPSAKSVAYSPGLTRSYNHIGLNNGDVRIVEAKVLLGEGDDLFLFVVSGSREPLKRELAKVVSSLYLFLAIFGLGSVISTFIAVKFGLLPLGRARKGLSDISEGKNQQLEGEFPVEIKPLIVEFNSLISANKAVVDRSRTQVGNLAHALKTPLSVLLNASRHDKSPEPKLIEDQVDAMQRHVQHYLDRAQIAARKDLIGTRTKSKPVIERLLRVMRQLSPQLKFNMAEIDTTFPDFKIEQQDFEEMVGNLVENASKFARTRVIVTVFKPPNSADKLGLRVEDDGPGISPNELQSALKRGERLDERKGGSGLGLSIVKDICEEYGGTLTISHSDIGGLKAELLLPAISAQ